MEIVVYSKENCPDCREATRYLTARGIVFEEKIIVPQEEADGLYKITREILLSIIPTARSVPQITCDGTVIGGLVQLKELILWAK